MKRQIITFIFLIVSAVIFTVGTFRYNVNYLGYDFFASVSQFILFIALSFSFEKVWMRYISYLIVNFSAMWLWREVVGNSTEQYPYSIIVGIIISILTFLEYQGYKIKKNDIKIHK